MENQVFPSTVLRESDSVKHRKAKLQNRPRA
jgi:hypothetical protein